MFTSKVTYPKNESANHGDELSFALWLARPSIQR